MVDRSHTAGWLPQAYAPLRRLGEKVAEWLAPKADAALAEDCYEISLELPGVAAGDIDVMVQDGSLTVQGEKRFEHEEAGWTYFFSEREYGAFQRSFRLPPDAAGRPHRRGIQERCVECEDPQTATSDAGRQQESASAHGIDPSLSGRE
jgi:HSP20 family protein